MSRPLRVGLIFGGASVEHEVSVISARGVASGFDPRRVDCVPIAVTEDGRWLPPERSREILDGEAPRVDPPAEQAGSPRLLVEPGRGALVEIGGTGPGTVELDVAFPLIHGWGGEDGRIQGLLELAGIPYVGSGVLGSALGMDKATAKSLFEKDGLPVGPWRAFHGAEYRADPEGIGRSLAGELGFPLFVKPSNGGSSVGITKVDGPDKLRDAFDEALDCDGKVVVEAGLDALEIECAVLGNEDPEASIPGEIVPSREFYDYAAKYEDGESELRIPAPIPSETTETVRGLSLRAFAVLELSGMARVDFLVERKTGRVYLNEVNTLPGFTPISMFPKLWEATGLAYPDLLDRLLSLALERWKTEKRRATRRRS
jgi:D-alanine-D-alanine ligase